MHSTVFIGMLFEKNLSSGAVTKYYFAGSTRVVVAQAGAIYYLHGDQLGSVSLVTTITGTVMAQWLYRPYGLLRYSTGTIETGCRYAGAKQEASTGFYQMGARTDWLR